MLDESICNFRGVGFILSLLFYFDGKSCNSVDPDQIPHYVALDLGLHCVAMTFLWVSR